MIDPLETRNVLIQSLDRAREARTRVSSYGGGLVTWTAANDPRVTKWESSGVSSRNRSKDIDPLGLLALL